MGLPSINIVVDGDIPRMIESSTPPIKEGDYHMYFFGLASTAITLLACVALPLGIFCLVLASKI